MLISNKSIDNKNSVIVFCLLIIITGIMSYKDMPRESAPDITIPYVFVSTPYKGAAAPDIETSITIPLEKKIKGVQGIKEILSISSEGLSSINIEFNSDVNIDDALNKIREKTDEAKRDLPSDLEDDPEVFEVNFSEMPIVVYALTGTDDLKFLKKAADDIQDEIESIKGILEVNVTGGREREIIVEVDPVKLAYYKIPITAFQTIITGENENTTAGSINLKGGKYQIRIPGEIKNIREAYNLVVHSFDNKPVYLSQLATITDGFKDETSRSRLNSMPSINISVKKRAGENIIKIIETTDKIIKKHTEQLSSDIKVAKLMDQSKDIANMVSDLENNIISGLILVIAVLFFVLGFRNAILVALSIPFSMLISFSILDMLNITLNMVVLFSLTLALGMLVDNAIVIIENIYRYRELGFDRIKAAKLGAEEVAYPVIGSTLTTLEVLTVSPTKKVLKFSPVVAPLIAPQTLKVAL